MRKILFVVVLSSFGISNAQAALFSLSGNHRFGSNWFYNLDTIDGTNPATPAVVGPPAVAATKGGSDTTAYLEHRILIRPDIIVDERFSIRTEFSLISQNTFDTYASSINQMGGGSAFDTNARSAATQDFAVRAAYLKWNSDIGVFRAGRMHKGWGLGLLYDDGLEVEDNSSTIVDRMSFEGQLGSLILSAAFEKYEEGSLYRDIDDEEVYEGSVKYENAGVSLGLLYGRHIRAADSTSRAAGFNSTNEFSFYAKKDWENFSIGGEVASVASDDQADVYGALAQMRWNPGQWNIELDGLYSSESGGRAFLVHPNYRPFLILFRQNLGANANGGSRYSAGVGVDPTDAAATPAQAGALLGRLGLFYGFKQGKYRLGLIGGYAQLDKATTNGSDKLGFEGDLQFEQRWYDNFKTTVTAGAFMPGEAFPGKELVWGAQVRSYLSF